MENNMAFCESDQEEFNPERGKRFCTRCGLKERVNGQRWCRECRNDYKRERRRKNKAPQVTVHSPQLKENTPTSMKPVPLLSEEANKALQEHEEAKRSYEELRTQNWYKSKLAPATVMPPAWNRVLEAEKRCQSLGVSPKLGEQGQET